MTKEQAIEHAKEEAKDKGKTFDAASVKAADGIPDARHRGNHPQISREFPPRSALLLLFLPPAAPAAIFHLKGPAGQHSPAISLRKRVHVNTLITEPGTIDIEWGAAFSTDGSFTFPTAIHYTPEGLTLVGTHRIQRQLRFALL